MSKADSIPLSGVVTHKHPAGRFTVRVNITEEAGDHIVDAVVNGKIRQHNIVISVGDRVDLEVSPYDLKKGRITYRHS